MGKREQGGIAIKIGFVFLAGAVGEIGVAYLKREIPVTPAFVLIVLGLGFILTWMLHSRITDLVECLWCQAKVPRDYSNLQLETVVCYICQRKRLSYPFGSKRVPAQVACGVCKRGFHLPFIRTTRDKKKICLGCIKFVAEMGADLQQYISVKGVVLSDEVLNQWITSLPPSQIRGWRPWIPFTLVLTSLILFGFWVAW